MIVRVEGIFLICFVIEFLLIFASNRLCGTPVVWLRFVTGAVIGGAYATICMLPSTGFLAHPLYKIVAFLIITITAYGISISGMRRSAAYAILNMALGGLSMILDFDNVCSVAVGAACVSCICYIGFVPGSWTRKYIPVEIFYNDKQIRMNALCDSGNLLKDPVSGNSVLVVGRDICEELTGLSINQLRNPVETLSKTSIPGLRLIPYKTVGQSGGMLLGLYFPTVTVGKMKGGKLVAFSPEILSCDGTYQALAGGVC